jgi:hypothetical protein
MARLVPSKSPRKLPLLRALACPACIVSGPKLCLAVLTPCREFHSRVRRNSGWGSLCAALRRSSQNVMLYIYHSTLLYSSYYDVAMSCLYGAAHFYMCRRLSRGSYKFLPHSIYFISEVKVACSKRHMRLQYIVTSSSLFRCTCSPSIRTFAIVHAFDGARSPFAGLGS